ncbi:peptide-methionine (S)-S-oxide reductase MsrA [Candidatus Nucleicultrix amoebiphila]|jgi:peptide-methionine (S)-S-oxide reductase|uniref:Peptide methionine sulfoxide reductase MsrA n=1 Tax=Candidatus Nucleicultrix amoebiphila FS5 TaxID=1414854 RepID=A0A1W6N4T4_9PROT|nr:peptide-methionine (S)-S-oxide reductase MsrA [Candidatus Nucleicultrix amoebiphila]ARN84832.1 hypothetical protein GQ61_05490 [Candidatus Nucleicultrix amoebiphila FS5]
MTPEEIKRNHYEVATLAGGCFWCMQPVFDEIKGVIETLVGYTGGHTKNPTYEEVCAGTTGHTEALQVVFDPKVITYIQILNIFWQNIDPLDNGGQFCDRGEHYRAEIFYHAPQQQKIAEDSKQSLEKSGKLVGAITTKITEASPFYLAENYHQRYHEKNPIRYSFYRFRCGRDQRLKQLGLNSHPSE